MVFTVPLCGKVLMKRCNLFIQVLNFSFTSCLHVAVTQTRGDTAHFLSFNIPNHLGACKRAPSKINVFERLAWVLLFRAYSLLKSSFIYLLHFMKPACECLF